MARPARNKHIDALSERIRHAMYRQVDALVDATRDLDLAEASGDLNAAAQARATMFEAGKPLMMALRVTLTDRMASANEPLDRLDAAADEIMERQALSMHLQFLIDTRFLHIPIVADTFINSALRELNA